VVELAEIVRSAGPTYIEAHAAQLLPSHRRALDDIVRCRTPALGGSLYRCVDCGTLHYRYHSCRNRHCPKCQEDRAQAWLERIRTRMLPCDHYLLTFTLPSELRTLARSHQTTLYAALLREAAATVQTLVRDRTWVGGTPGILAVLHTWSRTLAYHPHAHLLVTAGGLASDGTWIQPAHPRFLAPGYMLSRIFQAKMHDALNRAGLLHQIPPAVWQQRWNVHVQQIGAGAHALRYLSHYIFRVALTNQRIQGFENGRVTFCYTHARSRETRRLTFPVHAFLARFLQHVLPRGFAKVRSYGLLSPSRRSDLERARHLLNLHSARTSAAAQRSHRDSVKEETPSLGDLTNASTLAASTPSVLRCPFCQRGTLMFLEPLRRSRAPP
jgi:hypothetical protein